MARSPHLPLPLATSTAPRARRQRLAYRLVAGTAIGLVLASSGVRAARAQAQDAPAVQLPPLSIEGASPDTSYKTDQPSLPKLTEPLLDTPQSIDVVPKQYMQDRGINNINDAVRSVPGISLAAGEAGAQGNSLTLRGFTTRNDIFLDGMRDFGSYYRDPFNLEAIEVLKGPSSILFGRGSTGGVINQVSKQPGLDPFQAGSVSLGTDNTKRTTVDVNQPIPELAQGAAIRLDAMLHDSQVADRDVGEYQRYGVAPAFALGIGTPTRLNLNFFHQTEEDVPDYGLPFLFGKPAPVDRSNFYGFTSDYLDTNANIFTGKLEHDLNDAITLRDQFRYARYDRKARITEPQIPTTVTPATPLGSIQVNRNEITLNSVETFLQNQSDVTARFSTGFINHAVVAGFEVGEETSDPTRFTLTGVPTTSLLSPNPNQPFTGASTVHSQVTTSATSVGTYLMDTLKVGEQWELTGGVRWDSFDSSFADAIANTSFNRLDQMPSWRTALTYKPQRNGSVYFAYGTSFNPSAETLSLSSANANIAPEQNESYEVGSKWDFFRERLSLRGAVYRVEKTNARVPDPDNPLLNTLGGDQRVDGFELEATGRITEAWQVFTGYNYMLGKVIEASPVPTTPQPGAPLTNTPKHTLSVWTTYELPWRTEIGGGLNYVSSRVARNTAPFETVPGYYTIDALVKYHLTQNVDVQVNLYNLTDTNYIDLVHPAHIVPGAGRSALFSTNFKF